ncbi:MAG TPA: chitosanase, partial [Pyrinomonadaceae bacterium]|nr:chitosanase [Pyrinomonadaceae bacterium]
MAFADSDELKAVAIVSIFETGKAFGDFSAVAVLNDGAGISYGVNQFTHRSGALAAVLDKYLEKGGEVARTAIENGLVQARKRTPKAVSELAADGRFKNSLRAAALTREMKEAQIDVAFERFLQPAVDECEKLEFVETLSLAVVYDSITHGSWEKLRDEIRIPGLDAAPTLEHAWIAEYVKTRDSWLASIPRLVTTRYRTKFFLGQIERGNWKLSLPLLVHGVSLTSRTISNIANDFCRQQVCIQNSAVEPSLTNNSPSIDKSSVSSITLDDPP